MNALLMVGSGKKARVDSDYSAVRGYPLDAKVANPFLLPGGPGVRYYANEKMGSGHLMSMIGNSVAIGPR